MSWRSEIDRAYDEGGLEAVKALFEPAGSNEYTITLTGVFEAATVDEAVEEYRQWVSMPGSVEEGARVTMRAIT